MSTLVDRIHTAVQSFRRGIEAGIMQSVGTDITAPQMFMLYFINQKEKCKLTQIAERLGVKPSAVTVMIDRLENAGYVVRGDDPLDRRSILVELTDSGREVLARAVAKRNEIISSYFTKLQPDERELVTRLMEKMVEDEVRDQL
ncbi:MarR family transcriptional regulator [Paenibacillus sp. GD4]|jgi:MarR family transcriptional regulator, organic hydroperoxide resistance regulator|uniref:MarR family winged helix-turn-helix transcriptional regulator n=1 Tax=Paenibacillus TaxID=44249 RepID=UPI00254332AE|nr:MULTISPECIES: MarR family transcriptional regulator [Paenibacillus]MDQ1914408.1 MarR family transcriptional regulator [Paenibacillus sp. GD4]